MAWWHLLFFYVYKQHLSMARRKSRFKSRTHIIILVSGKNKQLRCVKQSFYFLNKMYSFSLTIDQFLSCYDKLSGFLTSLWTKTQEMLAS